MGKYEKLYIQIMTRMSDANIPFDSMVILLKKLGFKERIKGDHHILTMDGVEEIINLQAKEGKAKPYQVKQVREVILRYNLKLGVK